MANARLVYFAWMLVVFLGLSVPKVQSQTPTDFAPQAVPAKVPFKIASALSQFCQRACGITPIFQFITQQVAQSQLRRQIGGKVKVRLRTWSFTDLLSGKAKSLDIKSNHAKFKNIGFEQIEVTSITPIWVSYLRKSNRGLCRPALFKVNMDLKEKDLTDALSNDLVARSLRTCKLDLPGLGQQELEILEPQVNLNGDLLGVQAFLATKGADKDTGVPITIIGKPTLISNDRISLKDLLVNSPDIIQPEKFAHFVEELVNPIVNLNHFDRPNFAFRLNQLTISNQAVHLEGQLLFAPKPKPKLANET